MPALVIFETNVVMDIWLGRRGDQAVLLVTLAEAGRLDLVIPEFVLIEFQGTARRWVRDQRARLEQDVRGSANEWVRSNVLSNAADDVRAGANRVYVALADLERNIVPSSRASAPSRTSPTIRRISTFAEISVTCAGTPRIAPSTGSRTAGSTRPCSTCFAPTRARRGRHGSS